MFDLTLRMSASGGWRQGVDTWRERPACTLAMDTKLVSLWRLGTLGSEVSLYRSEASP